MVMSEPNSGRLHDTYVPKLVALVILSLFLAVALQTPASAAKNVILMVSDGAGFNTWRAASLYRGKLGREVYDGPGWVHVGCTTYPLNAAYEPTDSQVQDRALVYDPMKAWDKRRIAGGEHDGSFQGYIYLLSGFTDSAAAATAMATGEKTYENAINWSNGDSPYKRQTIPELAHARGKACGVATTVTFSDATPAALGGAHRRTRDETAAIAREMLAVPYLHVIMSAGHPDFDDDGRRLPHDAAKEFRHVGGQEVWQQIVTGKHPGGWRLVETRQGFQSLITSVSSQKILGVVQAANATQFNRTRPRTASEATPEMPFAAPRNANVPTLAEMARAALHCLKRRDGRNAGFYLAIEGGAVDWANHACDAPRMIEEQIDFVEAVEAVVAWVEANSNWDDTLLILTADHETGLLWGSNCDKAPFTPLVDRGAGQWPGMAFYVGTHSNSLVPLYARGCGSRRFEKAVRGTDASAAATWRFSGRYVDNTDIFAVMRYEMGCTVAESDRR